MQNKSLHDIRQIAQSYGIADIFSKDRTKLVQEIELKQKAMAPKPEPLPPRPEYDARLMAKPPSKISAQRAVEDILRPHITKGLHVSFPHPEVWQMKWGKREDTGTMRQPLAAILKCAERLMK